MFVGSVGHMGGRDFSDRELGSGPNQGGPVARGGNRAGFSQQQGRSEWGSDDNDLRPGRRFQGDMMAGGQRGGARQQFADHSGVDDDLNEFDAFSNTADPMGRARGQIEGGRGQALDFPPSSSSSSSRGQQFNSPSRGRMGGVSQLSADQGAFFDFAADDAASRKRGFDEGPGTWDRGGTQGGSSSDEQAMNFGRGAGGWMGQESDGGRDDFSLNRNDRFGSPRGGRGGGSRGGGGGGGRGGGGGGGGGRGGRGRAMSGGRGRSGGGHRGGRSGGGGGSFRGGRGR